MRKFFISIILYLFLHIFLFSQNYGLNITRMDEFDFRIERTGKIATAFKAEKVDNYNIKISGINGANCFYLQIPFNLETRDEKIQSSGEQKKLDLIVADVQSMSIESESKAYYSFKYAGFDVYNDDYEYNSKVLLKFKLIDNRGKNKIHNPIEEVIIHSEKELFFSSLLIGNISVFGNNNYGRKYSRDCYIGFNNFRISKLTKLEQEKVELEKQKKLEEEKKIATELGFASVQDYRVFLKRKTLDNFYEQVLYESGIPLEIGDTFTISANQLKVVDRVVEPNGYTYLVTLVSSAAENSLDYARTFGGYGGGFRHCFYIATKTSLNLVERMEFTTEVRYVTNRYELKLMCAGKAKYQRNYQDVDCYIFVANE